MIRIVQLCIVALACVSIGIFLQSDSPPALTTDALKGAGQFIGLQFSDAERDSMLEGLSEQLSHYEKIRSVAIANSIPPAFQFNPVPVGAKFDTKRRKFKQSKLGKVTMPRNAEDLPFYSVAQLGKLIKDRKITSEELTRMYLGRLKKHGPKLECVVTLTESLAIAQARRADREIAAGNYRGPLHGIPYGAKDLLATRGIPTTWGSALFRNQVFDEDATVVRRLEEAGAVLVAKLTLGELAWGDVWFGGKTRNPWNLEQGSSGSSAGSASATAAGLVAFAIGTETWGSIVSPSTRCGVTGLRPTYGRVSRTGAMALSWTMDKIGPMCRTVEDCAIVFNAMYGPDGIDQSVHDYPFNYNNPEVHYRGLTIGYVASSFDSGKTDKTLYDRALQHLRRGGAHLVPIDLPDYPTSALEIILLGESAAAFDELTRTGTDDQLVRQIKAAWPNVFRRSRFIPAVEYVQANRIRYMIVQDMAKLMNAVDLYVAPPFEGENLLLTNLTGHPCVVLPNGFNGDGTPTSITFIGRLFDEATLLAVAKQYQDETGFHLKHPKL